MKYIVSFVVGLPIGALMFVLALYYNPFEGQSAVSPLAVTDDRVIELSYPAVPDDALLFTNDGESGIKPHPARVAELWEPAVAHTRVRVVVLDDSRGTPAGVGIKFLSESEATAPARGEALANSVWHVYLSGQGTFMIDQVENFWPYIREVVVPAHLSSGDSWRGTFHGITTSGPRALGTARVTGGSGLFAGMDSESVESLTARAYSAATGPVSLDGSLAIAIPRVSADTE